jgi:hypothetical protein
MTQPSAATHEAEDVQLVDSSLMMKVFYVFLALALLSAGISAGGKWFGKSIALAGHTNSTTLREIVIGNNVIVAPDNMIRFERERHNGTAARLDLYLRWPSLDGYTDEARADFNHASDTRRIIFFSFDDRIMSRDMSGRLAPIYSAMLVKPGKPGPSGVTIYGFSEQSGYLNEVLAVAENPGAEPFVARCLSGASAAESLAPCERDIHVGDNLSLSYRFPQELLGQWRELDAAMRKQAAGMLKTSG